MRIRMDNKERLLLVFGILGVVLMVLFPPWQYAVTVVSTFDSKESLDVEFDLKKMEKIKTSVHIGYIFIGTPPSNFSASIDLQRLSIQFCAWVFIIATLYFICESYKEDNNAESDRIQ